MIFDYVQKKGKKCNNKFYKKKVNKLTSSRHGFHVGHGAHPPHRASQPLLNLLQGPAPRLRHASNHEYQSSQTDNAEEPEGTVQSHHRLHVVEALGNQKRARPIEASHNTGCRATNFRWQYFT